VCSLTNQANRRPEGRRASAAEGRPVERVVRARGATMTAKGGQANRADVLQWGRCAHYANSAAVSHGRALTRDALRLSLRCREDRPNVTVSQGCWNTRKRAALKIRDVVALARATPDARTILYRFMRLGAELNANLGAHPT